MKQLFAIFMIFQLWAAPAYAELSECAERLVAHVVKSIEADGMVHANNTMSRSDVSPQGNVDCIHCEDERVPVNQTSDPSCIDEVCAVEEVDVDYGVTSGRDHWAIMPLVKVADPDLFQPEVDRVQGRAPCAGHNRIYLLTRRIRI